MNKYKEMSDEELNQELTRLGEVSPILTASKIHLHNEIYLRKRRREIKEIMFKQNIIFINKLHESLIDAMKEDI